MVNVIPVNIKRSEASLIDVQEKTVTVFPISRDLGMELFVLVHLL